MAKRWRGGTGQRVLEERQRWRRKEPRIGKLDGGRQDRKAEAISRVRRHGDTLSKFQEEPHLWWMFLS